MIAVAIVAILAALALAGVHPLPGTVAGGPSTLAPTCSVNGTYTPAELQLATVGPCTAFDGTGRF